MSANTRIDNLSFSVKLSTIHMCTFTDSLCCYGNSWPPTQHKKFVNTNSVSVIDMKVTESSMSMSFHPFQKHSHWTAVRLNLSRNWSSTEQRFICWSFSWGSTQPQEVYPHQKCSRGAIMLHFIHPSNHITCEIVWFWSVWFCLGARKEKGICRD